MCCCILLTRLSRAQRLEAGKLALTVNCRGREFPPKPSICLAEDCGDLLTVGNIAYKRVQLSQRSASNLRFRA